MEEGARSRIEIETGSTKNNALSNWTAFKHVTFTGSELWVGEGVVADLSLFGWNDTISSLEIPGVESPAEA
jgi:hypothetical protein